MQQSKHIFKPFKNRNKAVGKERRLNAVKTVLNHQPHFPKAVTYEDIDQTMFDWLNNEIELNIDNKRFPTYKLFSNQRISEYGQDWKELDEKGNLEINFKTLTRENNPQKGDNQGNNFNIPGDRYYPIFQTSILEENGDEVVQLYSMKQPYSVNLIYTVTVFTSSYKKLNEMNIKMQDQFKALERYIFPNGFAMPMTLEDVGDESDYQIDDRKYYAQTYKLKLLAFVINESDYKVQKIPSRVKMRFSSGINSSNKHTEKLFKLDTVNEVERIFVQNKNNCKEATIDKEKIEIPFEEQYCVVNEDEEVEIDELDGKQVCWQNTDEEMYVNKKVFITINFNECRKICEFELDSQLELETLEMTNIKSFKLHINSEEINFEDSDVSFDDGDIIKVECELKNETEKGKIRFICYDPNTILDNITGVEENDEHVLIN